MATSKEKFQLVFEAQENASQKVRQLNAQLASLGGPKMLKSQNAIKKLERQVGQLSGKASKGTGIFSRFTKGIAMGNIIANVATAAWRAFSNAISGTIGAAAASEKQWQITTAALERHGLAIGSNLKVVRQFADEMQTLTGVADEEFGRAVQSMVDRGASLSQAFRMVAATADVAASKNKDMKRVLQEMVDVIGQKNLVILRKYGVEVDQNANFTTQLNTAISQLTTNFGGAASDAADMFGTRMDVLHQKFGDLQEKIGAQVLPTLLALGEVLVSFIDDFSKVIFGEQFDEQGRQVVESGGMVIGILQKLRQNTIGWVNTMVGGVGVIVNGFQTVLGAAITIASPIVDIFGSLALAVQGKFADAQNMISGFFTNISYEAARTAQDAEELAASFNQFTLGLTQTFTTGNEAIAEITKTSTETAVNAAAQLTEVTVAANRASASGAIIATEGMQRFIFLTEAMGEHTGAMKEMVNNLMLNIASSASNTGNFIRFSMAHSAAETTKVVSHAEKLTAATGQRLRTTMASTVDSMIGSMVTGQQGFADIFKGMAQDFMVFFIKQALSMIANMFIPGLGSLLGGIFDTPANDRMAAQQGRDFMQWFTRGALAEAQGGSELAVGITRSSNRIIPTTTGGGSTGSSAVIMHVNISGNVLTDHYIEQTIAPRLQRLVADGRSLLRLRQENITGKRDITT